MLVAAAIKSCQSLDAIAHCGLSAVELDAAMLAASTIDELQRTLEQHGTRVTTLDATAFDPGDDATALSLQAAGQLSAGIVVVSAGDDCGDAKLRQLLLEHHRRLADRAAKHGLVLAFETLAGLCSDSRQMLRTLEELQHPAVKLNFDTGRYVQQNPWSSNEVGLQRVFGHLASVRLTNFTAGVQPAEFPPLGQGGDVDFARTLQIVHGLEFAGPCTIAFQPFTRRLPTAEQCENWLRESVQHLRGCGWFD